MSVSKNRDAFAEWKFGLFIAFVAFISFGGGMILFNYLNFQYDVVGGILGAILGFLLVSYLTYYL